MCSRVCLSIKQYLKDMDLDDVLNDIHVTAIDVEIMLLVSQSRLPCSITFWNSSGLCDISPLSSVSLSISRLDACVHVYISIIYPNPTLTQILTTSET